MPKLTQKKRKNAVRVDVNISDELNKLALACRWLWKRLPQDQATKLYDRLMQDVTCEQPTAEVFELLSLMVGFRYVMAVDAAIEQHEKSIAEAS